MARTKRSAKLESKTKRLALPVGKQSIETISSGCYLAYPSGPVRAGVSLAGVAKQLGHANTRMVEAHCANLCPKPPADFIRP